MVKVAPPGEKDATVMDGLGPWTVGEGEGDGGLEVGEPEGVAEPEGGGDEAGGDEAGGDEGWGASLVGGALEGAVLEGAALVGAPDDADVAGDDATGSSYGDASVR
jgi:hypothetical protein